MRKKTKTIVEVPLPIISNPFKKSEDSEPQIKQFLLKINYLSQENSDLKRKVSDLQMLIRQKDEYFKQIFPEETKNSSLDLSSLKNPRGLNLKESTLQNVMENIYNENQRLYELLEKVSNERDEAKSKALINEQIAEDLQRKDIEKIEEYNKKIKKLTQIIDNKENYIKNLEKLSQQKVPDNNNHENNIYYKYVMEPNEQMVIMTENVCLMKGIMKRLFKKYQEIKAKNIELIQINYAISNEIYTLKNQPQNQKNFFHNSMDISSIEIFHKRLWEETENDNIENLSPVNSPLPDKIFKKPCDLSMISQNKPNDISILTNNPKVPKLDLTKAKKIQEINARKNFNQDSENKENEAKYFEKLKQFDNELSKCKMTLQKEMFQNKLLQEQNDDLNDKLKSFSKEITTLKKAETIYTEKMQLFSHYLNFYRNLYSKYLNILCLLPKNRQNEFKKEISMNKFPLTKTSPRGNIEDFYNIEDLDRKVKALARKDKEKSKSFNKTNQEIEEMLAQDFSIENPTISISKKQKYLNYLKKIANEFAEFLDKNKNFLYIEAKKELKNKKINVLELKYLQKAKSHQKLFRNNSEILINEDFETDLFEILSLRQHIQQKIIERKDLNLSKISHESDDLDINMSFLNENINDVSQTGEILIMNKFQNPFLTNFNNNGKRGKETGYLMANHAKVLGKLYSPLSKINLDIKEVSFENLDAKKLNKSFMSNNDELFF